MAPIRGVTQLHRLSRPGVVGVVAALLLLVGIGALGDTPDTRDSNASMAAWFTTHRADVFTSVFLIGLAAIALLLFVAQLGWRLSPTGASLARSAMTVVVSIVLIGNALIYGSLAYVVSAEAESATKALFELTLVTTTVVGAPMAAVVLAVAVASDLPGWFRVVSAIVAVPLLASGLAFRDHALLSPDVHQQVVWQLFALWVGFAGVLAGRSVRTRPQ